MTHPLPGPALLFCPADRPDRYRKAFDAADAVILDLEDAVRADRRADARRSLASEPLPDPDRVVVRVNPIGSGDFAEDLAAVQATAYRTLMVPKAEQPGPLRELAESGQWRLIALCETAIGVQQAAALAEVPGVIGLMWGAEDLTADIGGRSSRWPTGRYRDLPRLARSTVLLAAKAQRRLAVDSVYLDFGDSDGLLTESEDAAASGFDLKACIHPSQVSLVRKAFRPSDEDIAWARRVVAAVAGGGVEQLDGQMIDAPVIRQAEATLRAAGPL